MVKTEKGSQQNCYLRLLEGRVQTVQDVGCESPLGDGSEGQRDPERQNIPQEGLQRFWDRLCYCVPKDKLAGKTVMAEQGAFSKTQVKKESLLLLKEGTGNLGRVQGCCYHMQRENYKGGSPTRSQSGHCYKKKTKYVFPNTLITKGRPRRSSILYWIHQRTLPPRVRKQIKYSMPSSVFNIWASYPQDTQPPELEDRHGKQNKPNHNSRGISQSQATPPTRSQDYGARWDPPSGTEEDGRSAL